MNRLTDRQRGLCAAALASDRPVAAWRTPGGANFTIALSETEPARAPVFGGKDTPAFVIAPFDTEDGNLAYHLTADVLLVGDLTFFRDGSAFAFSPLSERQNELATTAISGKAQAPCHHEDPAAPPGKAAYEALVTRAIEAIRDGACEKIVLSRVAPRDLPDDYDLCTMIEGLSAAYPQAFVAMVSSQTTGTWIVATPEILLAADSAGVETMALAGTQWPDPGADISALHWPEKTRVEQAHVVDDITQAFADAGIALTSQSPPHTVQAANLCHLRSDFRAGPTDTAKLATLLQRLHPTSAVCGTPKKAAFDVIQTLESTPRDFYTGYLGPRNIGDGTALYVNLRSARIGGHQIFLHVGGGIVRQSDPTAEWEETVAKTQTILQVV